VEPIFYILKDTFLC